MQGTLSGNQVNFRRTYSSDNYLCVFTGALAADGRNVSGTQTCPGVAGTFPWSGAFVR